MNTKHVLILICFILIVAIFSQKAVEHYSNYGGCSGLDERECVQYPECLWHIDRYRNNVEGTCMSRKKLPEFIKQDTFFDRLMARYFYRNSGGVQYPMYQTPFFDHVTPQIPHRYYYTDRSSPYDYYRYNNYILA